MLRDAFMQVPDERLELLLLLGAILGFRRRAPLHAPHGLGDELQLVAFRVGHPRRQHLVGQLEVRVPGPVVDDLLGAPARLLLDVSGAGADDDEHEEVQRNDADAHPWQASDGRLVEPDRDEHEGAPSCTT